MTYARQTGLATARQRKQRRATITLTFLVLLVAAAMAWVLFFSDALFGEKAAPDPCAGRVQRVQVTVANTTGEQGLASATASALREKGFDVPAVGNDPLGRTLPGVGEVRYGPEGAEVAKAVAAQLPGATLVDDGRDTAIVGLVLGTDFEQLRADAPPAPTQPPKDCRPTTAATPGGTRTTAGPSPSSTRASTGVTTPSSAPVATTR